MNPFANYRPEVKRALPILIAQRFIGNVGVRFAFTFLGPIASGTGLSTEQLGALLAARDLTGATAPGVGWLTGRLGTRRTLLAGGVMATVGLALSSLGVKGLIAGSILFGLGKIGFDISMNAWVSDRIAYERRGKAIGLIEMSWAAAALLGLPLCGILIDKVGWWSVTTVLSLLSVPLLLSIRASLDGPAGGHREGSRRPEFNRQIIMTLAAIAMLMFCSQLLFVGHGLWLEGTYGFDPTTLGFAVVTLGITEAIASYASSDFTDRFGKRICVIAGTVILLVGVSALAVNDRPALVPGLALLGIAFLGFEFAFVSALPLVTELDPQARAVMIGTALGVGTVMRAVGSLVGAILFQRMGFGALMTLGAFVGVGALGLLIFEVSEPVTPPETTSLLN